METTPKSNGPFNKVSQPGAAPASDTMALIIDIQGAGGMSREDAQAYFDKLGKTVDDLRARNIPVTWVTMGARNHLYAPTSSDAKPRYRNDGTNPKDFSQLVKMGFGGVRPKQENSDIFRKFMREHGPQTNEAIYTKFFKGAFVEPEDYAKNPALRAQIQSDYRKNEDGTSIKLPEPGDYKGPSLAQYAHGKGVKNLFVVGAMSTNCDTETALSGNAKGFKSKIGVDRVLSWEGDEDSPDFKPVHMLWHDGDAAAAPDDFHRAKIDHRLDQIKATQTAARGISGAAVEAVRDNLTTTDDFLTSHPLPAAAVGSTVQTARMQPALAAPFPA